MTGTEVDSERARSLLEEVVSTPSVSGDEDECAELLATFFEDHDRAVRIDDVGDVRAPADDSVLLTSHIDTVPGEIPVRVEDDTLWGRGSVDAKGPLAAMAVAAVEAGVSFAGVVREETDSAGARYLIEDRAAPEALLNGEPSGWDAITLGYRGFLAGRYEAGTESAHTSRPEPNAIQYAVDWWKRVEQAVGDTSEAEAVFEQVTPKPTAVDGGQTENGMAVSAAMDVQFRIPPGRSVQSVKETVEDQCEIGTVEWEDSIQPVMASGRSPVARALREGIRTEDGEPTHLRKTGTSDMNLYADAWDVPMATYGPGDAALDHTPEERLSLPDFDRAVDILTRASEALRSE